MVIARVFYSLRIRIRGAIFLFFRVFSFKGGANKRLFIGRNCTFKHARLITIYGDLKIGNDCRIECFPPFHEKISKLNLGHNVSIGNNVHIGVANQVSIGDNVLLGSNILIIDHNHGNPSVDILQEVPLPPKSRPISSNGSIVIEKNVWICDASIILSGAHIGENAIIAAGSIVRSKVSPNTIYKN